MTTTTRTGMLEFDDGAGFPSFYNAPSASALLPGFVEIVSGSNYTITNSLSSGTKPPIGIVTQAIASAVEAIEVRTNGWVYMANAATEAVTAGQAIFPGGKGVISTSSLEDGSGYAIFAGGFGVSIKGAGSGADSIVQLARMG